MLLGTSCAVSGTGFFFSRKVMESIHGWKFHLLTEDIEFSVDQIIKGQKIGFCAGAVLYDEAAREPSASPGGSGCAGPEDSCRSL